MRVLLPRVGLKYRCHDNLASDKLADGLFAGNSVAKFSLSFAAVKN